MANKIVAGELYYELTGQLLEIMRQLRQPSGYPFDLEQLKAHLQMGVEGRFVSGGVSVENPQLQTLVKSALPDIDWAKAYDAMGLYKEFSEQFPDWKGSASDDVWTIPVIKGLTHAQIEIGFRKAEIALWKYSDNLDKAIPKHDRNPQTGHYSVSFKRVVEADPDQKNKSANMLAEEGISGITSIERVLLELGYFLTTSKHLDVKNVTLCSGSRDSDGDVPRVDWRADDRQVCVRWCYRDDANSSLRSRAVVSLPAESAKAG